MPRTWRDIHFYAPSTGFTLVEMAVVLIIIGLVMITVFPALTAMRASTARSATQANLQTLMRATGAYVQANGCLPCPTPASTMGNGFGRVRGDASASSPAACGTCAVPEGIPPYISLGIQASAAHDGWGKWISMRVDPALTVAFNVVPPSAACTSADVTAGICTTVGVSQKGLCKTGLVTINRINVMTPGGPSQQAAVVFASHGSLGYGSFISSATPVLSLINGCRNQFPSLAQGCPQALNCSSTSGEGAARCNASNALQFVDAVPGNGYDGALAYADRNTLVSQFGNGACQTVW